MLVSNQLIQTKRTTIGRHPERGHYDRAVANAILDEALVAHVGFDTGDGVTVLPMTYARMGDDLLLHGAVASRWLSSFEDGRLRTRDDRIRCRGKTARVQGFPRSPAAGPLGGLPAARSQGSQCHDRASNAHP